MINTADFQNDQLAIDAAIAQGDGVVVFDSSAEHNQPIIIPRRTGMPQLLLSCYGARFKTETPSDTIIKREYPATQEQATDGMTGEQIIIEGGTFAGKMLPGQVGIDIAASGHCTYRDILFSQLDIAAIQTACIAGEFNNCRATLCQSHGFISQSGRGEGAPLWADATVSNSAGNHSRFAGCRVYNEQGAISAYRVLANNGVVIDNCISEGLHPQYSIYYDNQNHTSGRLFSIRNFHNENLPTGGVVYLDAWGHTTIEGLWQARSGDVVLIDAQRCNSVSALVIVKDIPVLGTGQKFHTGTLTGHGPYHWLFEHPGSGGKVNVLQPDWWTGGIVPIRASQVRLEDGYLSIASRKGGIVKI